MGRNPILDLPLSEFMRSEIALPLQHVLKLYTVGSFLRAWDNPTRHSQITPLFDSAEQAHQVAALCAAWAGWKVGVIPAPASTSASSHWMRPD